VHVGISEQALPAKQTPETPKRMKNDADSRLFVEIAFC